MNNCLHTETSYNGLQELGQKLLALFTCHNCKTTLAKDVSNAKPDVVELSACRQALTEMCEGYEKIIEGHLKDRTTFLNIIVKCLKYVPEEIRNEIHDEICISKKGAS